MENIIMFKYISIFFCVFIFLFGPLVLVSNSLSTYNEQPKIRDFLFFGADLEGFTDNEVSHMEDVRFILNLGSFLLVFALVFVCIYFVFFGFEDVVRISSIISFCLVLFISFIGIFSFNFAFEVFHLVFFPQGNWMFPLDSKLIGLFPTHYFIEKSIIVLISTLSFIGISYLSSYYVRTS